MNEPVIDQAVFAELQATAGADFVVELVDTFLQEAPGLLAELQSARAAEEVERFQRAAHSLKSNGNTFGAVKLAVLAREIELKGLDCDATALDALEALFADAAAELKTLSNA